MEKIKEPTQEQIKEFWEWCGFEYKHDEIVDASASKVFVTSLWLNGVEQVEPHLDLNNLFKYAVPKLKGTIPIRIRIAPIRLMQLRRDKPPKPLQWSVCIDGNQVGYNHFSEDPALALFWAIYEAMHHED